MTSLDQIDLNTLVVFDAVAESGGFTAAAERLGVAKARVSIQIGRLESLLGVTLFTRTTRQVALTDAGRALHADCQPLLHGLQEAVDKLAGGSDRLTGTLRLGTTVDHAVQSLAPAVARFAAMHPQLQIDLRTGDKVTDLVAEGIDLAIRLGWLRDSSQRAVKLGEFDQYVVASPDHVRRNGRPRHPQELGRYDWIALTLLPTPLTWKFASRSGETHSMHMKSRIRVDSPGALRAMLRQGAGVSVLDQYSAQEDIRSGQLVRLLNDWTLPRAGIYAVFPPGRHMNARAKAFLEFYQGLLQKP